MPCYGPDDDEIAANRHNTCNERIRELTTYICALGRVLENNSLLEDVDNVQAIEHYLTHRTKEVKKLNQDMDRILEQYDMSDIHQWIADNT